MSLAAKLKFCTPMITMFSKKNTAEDVIESGKVTPFVGRKTELRSLHQALKSVISSNKPKLDIAYALDTIGQVKAARYDWTLAEQHFNQAISTYEQIGNRHKAARTRCHFAATLIQQGKPAKAESLLRQALAVFQELKLEHEIIKAQELLTKVGHQR